MTNLSWDMHQKTKIIFHEEEKLVKLLERKKPYL